MSEPSALIEFPADDPERARRFWSTLLGVELDERSAGQGSGWQAQHGETAIGVHERGRGPGDTAALPYLTVADLPAALEQVRTLGGTVIHPGTQWAVCRDSEGSPFGLALRAPVRQSIADGHRSMGADEQRATLGFLSIRDTDELSERGVRVLDPGSTLISRSAVIGADTIVYPSVVIDADPGSRIEIGEGCVLYPGSLLEARDGGVIQVGPAVELGPGGVCIRVGRDGSVVLEEQVRLTGGCELTGVCELGRGAQILGAIAARSVRLGGGRGGHRWPVADERGAVLKGAGIADAVVLAAGEVRSRRASFQDAPTERQSTYHPDAR